MKVYIVLQYVGESSRIIGLYLDERSAVRKRARLIRDNTISGKLTDGVTTHIIKKPLKGLSDLKFTIDGKNRYLESNRRKK